MNCLTLTNKLTFLTTLLLPQLSCVNYTSDCKIREVISKLPINNIVLKFSSLTFLTILTHMIDRDGSSARTFADFNLVKVDLVFLGIKIAVLDCTL